MPVMPKTCTKNLKYKVMTKTKQPTNRTTNNYLITNNLNLNIMNKKFTKLIAAVALLVFMAPSLVGWGQTNYTIGWGTATGEQGTFTNFEAVSGSVPNILSFSTAKNSSRC